MKRSAIRLKGDKTPRTILYLKGFLHGKIYKTAALDTDTNRLRSAYLAEKLSLLDARCHLAVQAMEEDLHDQWTEAAELITRYRLSGKTSTAPQSGTPREQAKASAEESAKRKNAEMLLSRLTDIHSEIISRELLLTEELQQAAHGLLSRLSAYGHGVVRHPISHENLPVPVLQEYLTDYHTTHRPVREELLAILKEA